ncbi:MAG TPA: RNA 3'-terminal phosphate cyclase [Candidatus Thermoplasmatota archaeon]|nr:RNA 3'-terminal phosphate cyclase [Candidatus Thermoplasmatota archaeon]
MRVVDGSQGEGGGQVLRVALALSAVARVPVRVVNVRGRRDPPGLKPQHVAAALAVAELCDGEIGGVHPGSTEVTLRPGLALASERSFRVGTAGSVALVLQAVLPVALASRERHVLRVEGGTDVPKAPSWTYVSRVLEPALDRLGARVAFSLERRGYVPVGRGVVTATVEPTPLDRVRLLDRGRLAGIEGVAHAHGLPRHVLSRATDAARDALASAGLAATFEEDHHRGPGIGMGFDLVARYASGAVLGASALGRRGYPAEEVGREAVATLLAEDATGAPVDEHLADQLPVLMAVAGGGAYRARRLSLHASTALDLVAAFGHRVERTEDASGVLVEIG